MLILLALYGNTKNKTKPCLFKDSKFIFRLVSLHGK